MTKSLGSIACMLVGGTVIASCVTRPAAPPAQAEQAPSTASTIAAPADGTTVRNGKQYVIERYDKRFAAFDQRPGWVRPRREVNVSREIARQDDQWVWVWTEVPPAATAVSQQSSASAETLAALEELKRHFAKVEPKTSEAVVRFEESSGGLPTTGSWRNSLAVADMNEDGLPDLITPAQRGELEGTPHVFLQTRDGSWREWKGIAWPRSLSYGSVVVADFDRDGHKDVAVAAHLYGLAVFRGDGRGHFTDASDGLPSDFPTRRLVAADVDADGWLDLVAISEGPGALRRAQDSVHPALLRAYRNAQGRPWTMIDVSGSAHVAGDWLATGDFNGDRLPDFVASTIYFDSQECLFLSSGASKWQEGGREALPPYSYTFAVAAGRFLSNTRTDDAIVTYGRSWPAGAASQGVAGPAATSVVGIDRVTRDVNRPRVVPIARWASDRPVWALAAADFNGDGSLDLAYVQQDRASLVILLNDGRGEFRMASVEGVSLPPNAIYDLRAADVDGDSRPDLVMMFESSSSTSARTGSIRVFLNRG